MTHVHHQGENLTEAELHQKYHHHHSLEDKGKNLTEQELHEHHHHHLEHKSKSEKNCNCKQNHHHHHSHQHEKSQFSQKLSKKSEIKIKIKLDDSNCNSNFTGSDLADSVIKVIEDAVKRLGSNAVVNIYVSSKQVNKASTVTLIETPLLVDNDGNVAETNASTSYVSPKEDLLPVELQNDVEEITIYE